jgi:polo-like kinase 4
MAERVKNEVLVHSQLSHKNILQLFHYFEDESNVYLVMELCENGELYSFLKRKQNETGRKGLDEYVVSQLLGDIAGGLQYMHLKKRMIHRDLKLSNILLDAHLQAKIADFGLTMDSAKPFPSDAGAICGTPSYLAP